MVVNDVGALAYYTNCKILDVFGLGSSEPILFRRKITGYTKEDVATWTASTGADIAILQPGWSEVRLRIPDEWVKVADWTIPRNVIFGDKTVDFYSIKPGKAGQLADNLKEFVSGVPRETKFRLDILELQKN